MRKERTYISGKMTGVENLNREAFFRAEARLKNAGHKPVNPHRIYKGQSCNEAMKADIKALLKCDNIYMLKGYKDSGGAMVELAVAMSIGLNVMYEE